MLALGFSTSLGGIILLRAASGALSGNMAVLKSALSEVRGHCRDDADDAQVSDSTNIGPLRRDRPR